MLSVGSVGDSCDNALAETSNGHFQIGGLRSFAAIDYGTLE